MPGSVLLKLAGNVAGEHFVDKPIRGANLINYAIDLNNYMPGGAMSDKGCEYADAVISCKSRCVTCPFRSCIKEIHPRQRVQFVEAYKKALAGQN
jgi:hypothetical protein